MANITYPYDETGVAVSNRIVDEMKSVQPPADVTEASIVVPRAAPFYIDTLEVRTAPDGRGDLLVEGRDFIIVYNFVAGTNVTGKVIAGGIVFTNSLYTGNVYLTYQTLGGDFVVNDIGLLEQIVKRNYSDVRFVRWDQIENVPSAYGPDAHKHDVGEITTFEDIPRELRAIADAILTTMSGGGEGTDDSSLIRAHISAATGAHTPEAVGLGKVSNYAIATEKEAAALASDRYTTPSIVGYIIRRMLGNENLGDVREAVASLDGRTTVLEQRMLQIAILVQSVSDDVVELNNQINLFRAEVSKVAASIDDLREENNYSQTIASQALAQSAATESNLQLLSEDVTKSIYAGTMLLPKGSYVLTLPPRSNVLFSAIGAGGGSGKWFQASANIAQFGANVSAGGDSSVYFLGTSEDPIEPLLILNAGGGQGGVNSYGDIGAIAPGGSGKCTRFRSERITVSSLARIDLTTDYVVGTSDTYGKDGRQGDTASSYIAVEGVGGWTVNATGNATSRVYGRGRNGVSKASTGGSGGKWDITLENDTTYPVRVAVIVGGHGTSARANVDDNENAVTVKSLSDGLVTMTYVG